MGARVLEIYSEPVTLEEARKQCYIEVEDSDGHPQDSSLNIYISAARDYAERFTGLSFSRKKVELTYDVFPTNIKLEAPATNVISIEYYDAAGELQTLAPECYILDSNSEVSWISLAFGYDWPTVQKRANAVKIIYETGFGDFDSEALPPLAKEAILLLIGHFFENREDTVEKALTTIPNGSKVLLRRIRSSLGMA